MAVTTFKYGDWNEVRRMLKRANIEEGPTARAKTMLFSLGNALRREVVGHIKDQDLDWAQLSSSTIMAKGHDQIYEASGKYRRSIKVLVTEDKNSMEMEVKPTGSHGRGGIDMEYLASLLEYGTSRMVARPLWRPSYGNMKNLPQYKRLVKVFANGLR